MGQKHSHTHWPELEKEMVEVPNFLRTGGGGYREGQDEAAS